MADTPIPKQQGLSQEDLDNMKPVEQVYEPFWGNQEDKTKVLLPFKGISSQKPALKNMLKECFVNLANNRAKIDARKEDDTDKVLRTFSKELASILVDAIKCQKVTINTTDSTVDTVVGTLVTPGFIFTQIPPGVGTGSGTAQPEQVQIT